MELTVRPFVTTGVALIGASMVAVAPLAPATPVAPAAPTALASPAVQLTSGIDVITPWAEMLDRALTNITALGTDLLTPPLPILQQVIVNQVGFLQDFLANPLDIFHIFGQMWDNLWTALAVPFTPDTDLLSGAQTVLFNAVSALLPVIAPDNTEFAQWLLDFTATPFSGWLMGEVGMFLSPLLELRDSLSSMFDAMRDGDWVGALNDLLNIGPHMYDGLLNGYGTVDLMGLLGGVLPDLPIGTIRDLNIELGGMLSSGGTLFGSIGADVCTTLPIVGCVSIPLFPMSGSDSGPIGSLIEISHSIAEALGWDGTGNPIDALLP